jgi:hypothetical protein
MWKYITYSNALAKIAYDKTADYVWYYTNHQNEKNNKIMDNINEYNDVLKIENYQDEKTNHRIYPLISTYDAYNTFFNNPTLIMDNIYLGSAFNAASYDTLKQLDITLIINVAYEIRNYFPDHFKYIKYNLYDDNKQSIDLESAYNDIIYHQKNHQGNILIHCYMGASRSASLVIYYIMKHKKHPDGKYYTFDEALEYTKNKRPTINPTFRFTKDLAKSIMIK